MRLLAGELVAVSERRTAILLVVLLLGQLALLTAQVPDPSSSAHNYLEGIALRVVAPVEWAISGLVDTSDELQGGFSTRRQLLNENEVLRRRIATLEQAQALRQKAELDLRILRESIRYEPAPQGQLIVADVVYTDHQSWLKTLVVHLPEPSEDVQVGSPVSTAEGLVGRVISLAGRYARVQLVSDRSSSVGAMVERTRRQGIARGTGDGELSLLYFPLQADVREGDRIVTAGIDGVYPRGIALGTVHLVESDGELFHQVQVAPSVDFGLLNQVFVWVRESIPDEMIEDSAVGGP